MPRRGAGAVERGSLENCWRRKALVGSNPTPSAAGRRMLADESGQLGELIPDALEFALTPYLGIAEAWRIIFAA